MPHLSQAEVRPVSLQLRVACCRSVLRHRPHNLAEEELRRLVVDEILMSLRKCDGLLPPRAAADFRRRVRRLYSLRLEF
jgi:hypothetical protein